RNVALITLWHRRATGNDLVGHGQWAAGRCRGKQGDPAAVYLILDARPTEQRVQCLRWFNFAVQLGAAQVLQLNRVEHDLQVRLCTETDQRRTQRLRRNIDAHRRGNCVGGGQRQTQGGAADQYCQTAGRVFEGWGLAFTNQNLRSWILV